MKAFKPESLAAAQRGNWIIDHSYSLHKNRNAFFENFNKLYFQSLTMGCFNNNLYYYQSRELLKTIPKEYHDLYYLAKAAAENAHGRKIVTWVHSPIFESILKNTLICMLRFILQNFRKR